MQRTPVAIIGAGPAGLLLGALLHRASVPNIIIERRSPEQVLEEQRTCLLEPATLDLLRQLQLEGCLLNPAIAELHLSHGGQRQRLAIAELTGQHLAICSQVELTRQLMQARAAAGLCSWYEAQHVKPSGFLQGNSAQVQFERLGQTQSLACDYIVGCDGFHGACRSAVPPDAYRCFERVYPFAWLGVIAACEAPLAEPVFAHHSRGFAHCSPAGGPRVHAQIQCSLSDRLEQWGETQFWAELRRRLDPDTANALQAAPALDRRITPVRSFVVEPLHFHRLLLAGDAAHVVPPTAGKGLNLAAADVADLAELLAAQLGGAAPEALGSYSERALRRVWRAERFSWWLTRLLHSFPDQNGFDHRIQQAELEHLRLARSAQLGLAEGFAGFGTGVNT